MDNRRSLLRAQLMAVCPGGALFHGAAVALEERSILFLAPSNGGKTTVAYHLASLGWRLIGDDTVVVARGTDGVVRTLPCGAHRMKTGDFHIQPAILSGIVLLEKGSPAVLRLTPEYGFFRAERIGSLMVLDMVPQHVRNAARVFTESLFKSHPAVVLRRRADDSDQLIRTWLRNT
ncbi:MAG: hypothetical protein R6V62_00965 [Candidatus Fermentibacteraceae bacterium]